MILNVHPIFVHFPIALLTTYGVLELIRFKKITSQPYWFYIKGMLVIVGAMASYVAAFFGDIAKSYITDSNSRAIISKHEFWAHLTIIIFTILAIGYVIQWLKKTVAIQFQKPIFSRIWTIIINLQIIVTETKLTLLLALAGVLAITITGALGGTVVYGKGNDPFTDFIFNLVFR